MVLEADEVVGVGHQILLPELDDGVWRPSVARVCEPDGFHRPEPERVHAPARKLLNRQTRLEPARLLEAMERDAFGLDERLVETRVLLLVERAVDVVVAALAVARGAEGDL